MDQDVVAWAPRKVHADTVDGIRTRPDVVLDLLHELRASRYLPAAWVRFVVRSWRLSQQTAQTHPHLVHSWRRAAVGLTLAEGALLLAEAHTAGGACSTAACSARRAAPGAALCLAYTLADAYVHLGLNRDRDTTGRPDAPHSPFPDSPHEPRHEPRHEPLYDTLGMPTVLTLTRGAAAGVLFGHLLSGAPAPCAITSTVLTVAGITDVADGYLARRLRRTTRLGAYLDSEADFGVGLALTLTLRAQGRLPSWLVAGTLTRWFVPFAYTLFCYFGRGRRVQIGSTRTGKAAGVAQTLALGMALLPERVAQRSGGLRRTVEIIAALLLIAAPFAQLERTVRTESREQGNVRG